MQGFIEPKSRTKICYVITKGNWGGAQKYVYSLATSLPKDKYDVVAIVGVGGILKNKLEEKGIKVFELLNLKRDISIVSEIKSFFELLKIIWKESPDVLHLNSPKASGLGSVVGRLCRVPKIIQTIHGWSFNEKRFVLSKFLIYFFSGLTVLLCHKTIVIAQNEKKQALRMPFVKSHRIVLIRNGVEQPKHIDKAILREAILARVGLPFGGEKNYDKMPWLGTIAELHKNKGLKYAIEALAKIDAPFMYFILGGGEEEKRLQELINKNHLQNKVFLVGFVEDASLYLKAFDIFLLTSIKEGLPYTILEAGLAGLPVIASSVGGIPDIIYNGKNGILVESGDVEKITKSIEMLFANPEKRKNFGEKLQKKVEKDFSVEKMIEKTVDIYN